MRAIQKDIPLAGLGLRLRSARASPCLSPNRCSFRAPPWPIRGFAAWTLTGAGIGIGSIVPGASVAFLLIFFGIYQPMLDGVARLDLGVLIPLGLGAGTAILTLAKAVDWFFRAAESFATRCVLGLVAGSIVLVFPGWPGGKSGVACILLLLLGAFLSSKLNRLAPPRNMRTSNS